MKEKIRTLEADARDAAKKANADAEKAAEEAETLHQRVHDLEASTKKAEEKAAAAEAEGEEQKNKALMALVRMGEANEAFKENLKLLHHWRPSIYQAGFDLCRSQVLAGTPVDKLPAAVLPPPGWWGCPKECLEGQDFDDYDVESEEEEEEELDEDVEDEEIPDVEPASAVEGTEGEKDAPLIDLTKDPISDEVPPEETMVEATEDFPPSA
jgi:hypothetical protein